MHYEKVDNLRKEYNNLQNHTISKKVNNTENLLLLLSN